MKIGLLPFLRYSLAFVRTNRPSVFIGNANRYASVDLSDFVGAFCAGIRYFGQNRSIITGVAAEIVSGPQLEIA